ncbi:MAG: TonB-dependent receptor [Candidatus Azobacteroides sp.]|nr:TonB-dependent receptor [Candidatus Azobacteroides sp.]
MKSLFLFIFFTFYVIAIFPENRAVEGYVYDSGNQPVIGAGIYLPESKNGTTTDEKGFFSIYSAPQDSLLEISYIGYKKQHIPVARSDRDSLLKIVLNDGIELDEVVVNKRTMSTVTSSISPLNTQKITYAELCRAACCSLAESFETNPSVDVSYSDAATGARQIRLLGLSGTYVQMLTENYPNFRGAASLYGLDYVPGPWMESIQVSKGTSSVKNGYEALAGQINVEFKKPQNANPLSVNLFVNDAGRYEVNADGAVVLNKKLSTGLLAHYSDEPMAHDDNGDGFLDIPKRQQFNIFNRWLYQSGNYISQAGVKYLHENRESGQDISGNIPYSPYQVDVKTDQAEAFTKNAYLLGDDSSVALIVSGSYYDRNAGFGAQHKQPGDSLTLYNVKQSNVYASLMYETEFSHTHRLSTGISFNYDGFRELLNNAPLNTHEAVPGMYAQYTLDWKEKLVVLAGIRADYSSRYDFFVTPRLHVKYDATPWLQLRASAGKGFRTANVLAENNFLFASSRKVKGYTDKLNQEEAWNYGLSAMLTVPLFGKDMILNTEYYYTDFLKQVVADMDSNPHEVSFYNLNGKSYSKSFQVEITYPFFEGFTLTGAYRLTDSKTTYNGKLSEKPLTSKYKSLVTASYKTPLEKWQFDFTAQFNGGGRMPTPDAANPMWNERFGAYTIFNGQITKYFRNWSIYAGGENLSDFTQKNPIIAAGRPYGDNFDATMIWGPTHGRKLYLGVRFNLPKK